MLENLIFLLLGVFGTWFCAWYYYKKAGDELKLEAKKLRETTSLILAFLENKEHGITVKRNEIGEPVGLIVDMSATLKGTSKMTGVLTDASKKIDS